MVEVIGKCFWKIIEQDIANKQSVFGQCVFKNGFLKKCSIFMHQL